MRANARTALLLGVPAFVLAYAVAVTLVTVAANGWYPVGTADFCGSLGDFVDGAYPEVCLSFVGYWGRAALHPPFAALSALAGLVAAGAAVRAWRPAAG